MRSSKSTRNANTRAMLGVLIDGMVDDTTFTTLDAVATLSQNRKNRLITTRGLGRMLAERNSEKHDVIRINASSSTWKKISAVGEMQSIGVVA